MLNDKASRLTARVAPYLVAIAAARAGGLTWADIGRSLGVASPGALRQAVAKCPYKTEQAPLPEPQAVRPPPGVRPAPGAASGFRHIPLPGDEPVASASGKKLFDSLPKI